MRFSFTVLFMLKGASASAVVDENYNVDET